MSGIKLPKSSVELFQKIASDRGGKCRSKTYEGARNRVQLECSLGHVFAKFPYEIKNGIWCPHCSKSPKLFTEVSKRLYNEKVKDLVKSKGGIIKSKVKITSSTQVVRITCANHPEFKTTPNALFNGVWCRECGFLAAAQSRITPFKVIRSAVSLRRGKLITTEAEYLTNPKAKLKLVCENRHIFEVFKKAVVSKNTWCQECGKNRSADAKRGSIEAYRSIIEKRRGKLLSTIFRNNTSKLHVECEYGHSWHVSAGSLKQTKNSIGSWCPDCRNSSRYEKLCRAILEYSFKAKFPRVRPEWLRFNGGSKLELDGFNERLKIAFEYQGPHHYKNSRQVYNSYSEEGLADVLSRDRFKVSECKKQNVALIVIPDLASKMKLSDLENFLTARFKKLKLSPSREPDLKKIDLERVYIGDGVEYLTTAKKLASKKGGKLLTEFWTGNSATLEWECSQGHKWLATYQNVVKNGSWCDRCQRLSFRGISQKEIQTTCRSWGLSLKTPYKGARAKAKFKCLKNGHEFERIFFSVSKIRKCPLCPLAP